MRVTGGSAVMIGALLEVLAGFIFDFVFYTLLYGIGCLMLRVITLGRYQ